MPPAIQPVAEAPPPAVADGSPLPEVSIVVPVYDERDNLRPLDTELREMLGRLGRRAEIVYVDDGSTDGSPLVLAELLAAAARSPFPTRLVRLRRNYGQTAALAAGFDHARAPVIVALDADGQNDPADVPRLLARLEEGFDLVSGWRRHRRDAALSRLLPSRVGNWLAGRISGLPIHDYGCTLKAYRASRLHEVHLYGEMHRFLPAHVAGIGGRVAEVEVGHRPRRSGSSKYGLGRIFKVLLDLVLIRYLTHYFARPLYFFGQIAHLFLLLTGAVVAVMVVFKYGWLRLVGIDYQASFIQTPLPALAATFFLGGVMSVFFGILGELLTRVHHEAQGLKPYRVAQVEESAPGGGAPDPHGRR